MLISIDTENGIENSNREIQAITFKELGLKESDIEEFLRKNINIIADDESLLIVGQQVIDSQKGRSDLTAVDENGNLVLIEIKRDKADAKARKEPIEFQAIRYAASLSKIKTPDELVSKIYESYIEKHDSSEKTDLTPSERAKRLLFKFLEDNNALKTFNNKQKIILVASSFENVALSSVAWLISNNVNIACYTLEPVKINSDVYLEVKRILPVSLLEDYYTEVKEKISESSTTVITRTNLPRMPKLLEWGIIKLGDKLSIKNQENSEATVNDAKSVNFQNENMSFNEWGQKVTGWSSICIYNWAETEAKKTLSELRKEKIEADNKQEIEADNKQEI